MKVEISNGELVDKVAILSIKLQKMKDTEKLEHVESEYAELKRCMDSIGITDDSDAYGQLQEVNLKLWDIEDKIRQKEAGGEFDEEFIQLARAVYHENDRRSQIKRDINITTRSTLIEEKEYITYR